MLLAVLGLYVLKRRRSTQALQTQVRSSLEFEDDAPPPPKCHPPGAQHLSPTQVPRALLHTLRCDQSILLQIFTDCSRFKARTADLKLLKLLCPGDHRLKPIWCFALWNEPNACSVQFHYIFHYFRKLAGDSIGSRPVLCTRGPSKPAG